MVLSHFGKSVRAWGANLRFFMSLLIDIAAGPVLKKPQERRGSSAFRTVLRRWRGPLAHGIKVAPLTAGVASRRRCL